MIPLKERKGLHALVLFARFGGEAPRNQSAPSYSSDLFDEKGPGSLAHFYRTMSAGGFALSGTVLPRRYAAAGPASAYVAAEPGARGDFARFVREILRQADEDVDFGRFDNDGPDGRPNSGDDDGVVDYIFIEMLSVPYGFLLEGATGIAELGLEEPYPTRDPGRDGEPIVISGTQVHGALSREGSFAQTVGVMAHEFGHSLGLPDLFDLEYGDPPGDSAGIGRWGLMGWGALGWKGDDGPNPLSAWSLEELGWIGAGNGRLVEVRGDSTFSVREGRIYKITLPRRALSDTSLNSGEEYLLLEERTRAGSFYNRDLPGEGLLVWHVRREVENNSREEAKRVDLVSADGLYADAGFPQGRAADPSGGDNLDFWAHDTGYREAHAGNRGDGTDPFDGVRFARLDLRTNPSIDLGGLFAEASTGLSLRLEPEEGAMRVEVRQPRWAGTIRSTAHWAGTVLVDGDVRVAPGGRLLLHPGARVLFAGGDRRRGGRNYRRSEIEVQGEFFLLPGGREKLLFAALHPGDLWQGIFVDPEHSGRVHLPAHRFEVRDAAQGIVLVGAPPGAQGKVVSRLVLDDGAGLETAGNGDAQLNPGETVQPVVEVSNWSLLSLDRGEVQLSWDRPLLLVPQKSPSPQRFRQPFGTLFPGHSKRVRLPGVMVQPGARPGQEIQFALSLHIDGNLRRQREIAPFRVRGRYPEHTVEFSLPEARMQRRSALLLPRREQPLELRVRGEVERVDLVLRRVPDLKPVGAAIATTPQSGGLLGATLPGLAPGLYELVPRIRSPEGAVVFSPSILYLWVTSSPRRPPALVFVGERYARVQRERFNLLLREALRKLGRPLQIVNAAPADGSLYQVFLQAYGDGEGLVIWLGAQMDETAQRVFRAFLERGGRVFFISDQLDASPGVHSFLREVLHATRVEQILRNARVRSFNFGRPVRFNMRHVWMELAPPAEPVLLDQKAQPAALRLDMGTYRLVYFPFEITGINNILAEVWPRLIEAALGFLEDKAPAGQEVEEDEVPGTGFSLEPNFPNPFNPRTTISYTLGAAAAVELTLYNIAGQVVRRLVDRVQQAGRYQVVWNGRDHAGRKLGSGVYFYRLKVGRFQRTRRLLLLK